MEAVDEQRLLLSAQARQRAKKRALQPPQRQASFLSRGEWPAGQWDLSFVPAPAASNLRLPRPNRLLRQAPQLAALPIATGSAVAEEAGCDATACTRLRLQQRRPNQPPQLPRAHRASSVLRSAGLAEAAGLQS